MGQLAREGPPSPEKTAQMNKTAEAYNAQLEQLLGTEAAEAYRKQGLGRVFNANRAMPPMPSGR